MREPYAGDDALITGSFDFTLDFFALKYSKLPFLALSKLSYCHETTEKDGLQDRKGDYLVDG